MKYFFSALLFVFLIHPLRADTPSERKTEEVKPVKVPFTLMPSGHFILSVKVNDKGPYKLIFDTGAPISIINTRMAKESGILDKKTSAPLFAPFGTMGQLKVKSLEVGPLKAENVGVMVMNHPTVQAFSDYFKKEGPIDGILGFPFFAPYKMVVDYQAKELTFTPNGYKPTDTMESMMKSMLGGSDDKGKPKVVAASGQWGLVVGKAVEDQVAGVVIETVMPNSAASKAGLKAGDRLLTIDGRWTDSVGDTYQAAGYIKAGQAVPLVINREGKEMKLLITPANGL